MDISTDKGRVENELFVILFCKQDDTLQEIRTCARYFVYWSQQGLMQMGWCRALKSMGEREFVLSARELPVLVGCGTDDVSTKLN